MHGVVDEEQHRNRCGRPVHKTFQVAAFSLRTACQDMEDSQFDARYESKESRNRSDGRSGQRYLLYSIQLDTGKCISLCLWP